MYLACFFVSKEQIHFPSFHLHGLYLKRENSGKRKNKKSVQKRRVVKCYYEMLQRKGLLGVASFSRSVLGGNRQECSARCHRLGAPKFPGLFCGMSVMRAGCLFAGASRKLFLLPPAHLGRPGTSLQHGPSQGLSLQGHDLADTSHPSVWGWSSLLFSSNLSFGFLYQLPPPSLLDGFTPLLSEDSPEEDTSSWEAEGN